MTVSGRSRAFRSFGAALISLIALGGLAGCVIGPGGQSATAPVATQAALEREPLGVKDGTGEGAAGWTAKPKPAPEKIYPPPSDLSGMRPDQVVRLLGEPGFRRNDEPAQIWQYRTQVCALDLFLYRSGDGYRVNHFETRNRQKASAAGPVSEKDCFVGLLKRHEQGREG